MDNIYDKRKIMTYEIKYEPVIIDGVEISKYNIYYYENDTEFTKEFYGYSLNEPKTTIKLGYTLKN